jgi:predicted branched-subunit amino acid permease
MRPWPLSLQPRFIVYTTVVLVAAVLSVVFFLLPSIYVAIPLALSAFLAAAKLLTKDEGRRIAINSVDVARP